MNSDRHAASITSLFSDIEGSTRLWDEQPARMSVALALHDALARAAIEDHHGVVVKMTGDGIHAAFDDPLDALDTALRLQQTLADPAATNGMALRVRCALHAGWAERRDNDFFGSAVNRAARIMSVAHGGQLLVSQAVADRIEGRLPPDVALRDLGAVRLRDLTRAERVYQVLHPRLRRDFPALRSLDVTPNNLPQQVTSFVGRERELRELSARLAQTRLLTLFGMGGLGKTRLSLQLAAAVMDDYPDGVWFVELASVIDPRLVPQAVASVLGVVEDAGRPVLEALTRFLSDRQLLLVLDNCEHLVSAVAVFSAQVLQAGARIKVLASSRERLRVAGETTCGIAPFALPDPGRIASVDALLQYEAVRLFVDRATAVQPGFAVTAANAKSIAEICGKVDGVPLAIELAAARIGALSVENIAERLADRFRLLTRGPRAALPRHRTLRALVDWSYDLLGDAEKTLFARLSVFAAGFTLEAAETVGTGGAIDASDVLELLTALVDKSLVAVDAQGERYRLLETVRQYARERLESSGEAHATCTRHLDYFVDLVEKIRPQLWGPQQGAWLARLDPERDNLLAAHAWCDHAAHGAEQGLRLAFAAQLYWLPRGLIELGYRLTTEALARPGAQAHEHHRGGALYAASQIAYFMGSYEATKQHAEECLAIARRRGERERAAAALLLLGYGSGALHERDAAQRSFEASAALARELGDKARLSFALNALAGHHAEAGDLARAESLFEEALALARETADDESIAIGLPNLARIVVERGVAERARALLREGLAIARRIGSARAAQNVLEVAAGLAVLRADWARAARWFGAVDAQMAQMGMRRTPEDEAFVAARIDLTRDAMSEAAFDDARSAGYALSREMSLDEANAWLAR